MAIGARWPYDEGVPVIPQSPERYLRSPRLEKVGSEVRLYVIAWDTAAGTESLLTFALDEAGTPTLLETGPPTRGIVALAGTAPATADAELGACDLDSQAWIEMGDGTVELRVLRGNVNTVIDVETVVWRARGSAAAPAVLYVPTGTWVAWHHDVREDSGQPDVAKWIELRFVDLEGRVFAPAAPMVARNRDLEGEEQSFEFPALAVGPNGAVVIVGRGSHNFWRQDLSADGWTERQPLSDGSWGSRGRRPTVLTVGDSLFVARRDRKGIEIDVLEAPQGGFPELVPAPPPTLRVEHVAKPEPRDPASQRGRRTYFGDIQQHSAHSDGVGSAEEVYQRARWRYRDDFVALTDHESFLGKRTGPGEWEYLQQVADAFDAPGEFATLIAYEWTGKMYPGPGHKCVYLPRRGMPIVSRDDVPEGRDLVQAIKAVGGVASPHHIGWTGCDEGGHDPEGQPVWEICSCHGCYETEGHPLGMRGEHTDQLADVMLRKGHRFGFTASSDSHGLLWHHGESRKRDPYRTGLTAVLAPELTREAIFEGIRTRSCYGTSGAKILLDVRVGGRPMGSELDAGPVSIEVDAVGESALERIDLVTERGVVHTVGAQGAELAFALERFEAAMFVYARVVQKDGEQAWSSPVFFD